LIGKQNIYLGDMNNPNITIKRIKIDNSDYSSDDEDEEEDDEEERKKMIMKRIRKKMKK
jgi:hypothetical protein